MAVNGLLIMGCSTAAWDVCDVIHDGTVLDFTQNN